MSKFIIVISLFISITFLAGCGTTLFSHRETNPSIQDMALNTHFWPWSKQGLNTFSTTASRRMVLTRIEDWGHRIISCAEPSPDVGEAFKTSIYDALKLAIKHDKSQLAGELANTYKREVQTEISSLLSRSQGLQLFRNATHNLCMDRMNDGWVLDDASKYDTSLLSEQGKKELFYNQLERVNKNKKDYDEIKLHIFNQSVELIKLELKNIRLVTATAAVSRALDSVEKSSIAKNEADKLFNSKQKELVVAEIALKNAKTTLEKATDTDKSAAKKAVEEATSNVEKINNELKFAQENVEKAKKDLQQAQEFVVKMQAVVDKILLAEVVTTK
ncbi:hypothetical protein [Nitrosomonas ureae]|uniref:Lipoprotein n=1 Tax=Nitrosomonas ureae TaxID=44577 RepID=A0A1H9G886_9PROT|nr:hypothetical protein [Nitrosomonas ureae]SEQ46274.1 hypothetical protein SAMN05421510_10579 [Nitrosomonas ureae]